MISRSGARRRSRPSRKWWRRFNASRGPIRLRRTGARWRRGGSPSRLPGSRSRAMSITYLEAIREAQARALKDDPRVFIYGQDVAQFGGAFKATKNLLKEFPGRVLDAPISE